MSPVCSSQMVAVACFFGGALPAILAMRSTVNDLRKDYDAPAMPTRRFLEDGLDYLNHIDQPQEAKAYLRTSGLRAMPWPGSQGWITTFENAVKSLPSGVETDDHQGTPIGEGESIGLMAATMQMDADQLQLLPSAFQKGLFATRYPSNSLFPFSFWGLLTNADHQEKGYLHYFGIIGEPRQLAQPRAVHHGQ